MSRGRYFLLTVLFFAGLMLASLQQVTLFRVQGSGVSLGTFSVLAIVAVVSVWQWLRHGIPSGLRLPLLGLGAGGLALALSGLTSSSPNIAMPFVVRYASELAVVWVLVNLAWAYPASGRAMARAAIWFSLFSLVIGGGAYLGHGGLAEVSLGFHNNRALVFYQPRVSAIYEHPGIFASIGLMAGLLAVHLRFRNALGVIETALGVLSASIALVLAQTRNPLLVLLLSGVFFLAFGHKGGFRISKRIWFSAVVGATLALTFVYWLRYADFAQFEYAHASLERVSSGRTVLWAAAFHAWLDYPWFGTGPGVFEQLVPVYTGGQFGVGEYHAHNLVLMVLSETGVIGLLACLGMVYALWAPLLKGSQSARDRFLVVSWLVVLLLFGVADFYFHSYGFALHCAMVVAFLYGEYGPRQGRYSGSTECVDGLPGKGCQAGSVRQ